MTSACLPGRSEPIRSASPSAAAPSSRGHPQHVPDGQPRVVGDLAGEQRTGSVAHLEENLATRSIILTEADLADLA